jgi:hypothetical protein
LKRFTDTQQSNTLAGHFDIDLTDSSIDAFLDAISEAFGVPWVNGNDFLTNESSAGAKHLPLRGNQGAGSNAIPDIRYFEYYPKSTTTGKPTIAIVISQKTFKFRLNK